MIVDRLVRALDNRLNTAPVARKALAKIFPDHWSFMFGEIALYSFVALVLTGVYLTLFFEPSVADTVYTGSYAPLNGSRTSAAYASTVRLSFDVRAGLLMRQAHHWSALLFIAAIVLHLLRIFFTGAFRKPREINWLIGVTMLTLALLNGFTGYSIPDDLLSGTGLRIFYSVIQSIPVVGEWLAFLVFGGEFPADATVPRLFVTHVLLVPAVLTALIAAHLGILVKQKHSQFPGRGRTENNVVGSRFWPSYTIRTLSLFAWVLAVVFALGGLAQINPVWIYGPFDPAQVTSPAQPDWYIAWGDGALRLLPAADFHVFGYLVPGPFWPGVVLGALTFTGLYLWPFLERRASGRGLLAHELLDPPREHPVRIGVGAAVLAFYTVLLVGGAYDVISRVLRVPVLDLLSILRVLVLALPVPVGVAAYLVAHTLRTSGRRGIGDLRRQDLTAARRLPAARTTLEGGTGVPERVLPTARGAPSAEPSEGGPAWIELWQERDGTWRWRYRVDDVALTGNQAFLSRPEAEQAAEVAYGQLPRRVVAPPGGSEPALFGLVRRSCRRIAALAVWLILWALGKRHRRRRY